MTDKHTYVAVMQYGILRMLEVVCSQHLKNSMYNRPRCVHTSTKASESPNHFRSSVSHRASFPAAIDQLIPTPHP